MVFFNYFFEKIFIFKGYWFLNKSPIDIVRYGWILHSKETLQCITCLAIIKLSGNNNVIIQETEENKELKENFEEIIESYGHKEYCPWKNNPCSLKFSKLEFQNQNIIRNNFFLRFISIIKYLNQYSSKPILDITFIKDFVSNFYNKL